MLLGADLHLYSSVRVFECGLEDESLKFVVVDEAVLFDGHCVVEALNHRAIGDA